MSIFLDALFFAVTLHQPKHQVIMKEELLERITDAVFLVGSEVNEGNAYSVAELIKLLYDLREFIKEQ